MNISNYHAVNSFIKIVQMDNEVVLNVIKNPEIVQVDEPTYAKLKDFEFENGSIEVKVYSQLLKDAPDFARGFIGIAFHINEDDTQFEGIYIRPTNSRVNDQLRRNRSTQYFSYPNHKFDDFRRTDSGKYESYVDIGIQEWIDFKVVIKDETAALYINKAEHPCLVVNDLKHGKTSGSIALWSEVGTDAYFKDLVITKEQ
jgi:hypothetical protein